MQPGEKMIGPDDCTSLTAGCDHTNKLVVKNSCDKINTGNALISDELQTLKVYVLELTCHDSWKEESLREKHHYTIVSYKPSEASER